MIMIAGHARRYFLALVLMLPIITQCFCCLQVSLLCHEDLKPSHTVEKMDHQTSDPAVCHQLPFAGQNLVALQKWQRLCRYEGLIVQLHL